MRVLIIGVSYNTPKYILNYLNSISRSLDCTIKNCQLDVYICENGTDYIDLIPEYKFNFTYFKNSNNNGYFGGIDSTIKNFHIEELNYDYLIFSNVDLELDFSFFSKLQELVIDNQVACFAPSIFVNNNFNHNPWKLERYTLLKLRLIAYLFNHQLLLILSTLALRFFRFFKRENEFSSSENMKIYAAHGCFYVFNSQVFRFDFILPYPNLLFGEELVIAEELRIRNLKTIFIPQLKVFDFKNGAISLMKKSKKNKMLSQSIKFILNKYYI